MNILWVEDHIEDNGALLERVEASGGDVLTAENLEHALQILEMHPSFGRYIVDLKIPLGPDLEAHSRSSRYIVDLKIPLGPNITGYVDTNYNGTYVLEKLREMDVSREHIVCLSNFRDEASGIVAKFGVKTINKEAYHTELLDALGLTSKPTP